MPILLSMVPAIPASKVAVGTALHWSKANCVISFARSMVMKGVTPSKS